MLSPEIWSLESHTSRADLPEYRTKEFKYDVALASVASLIGPPCGDNLMICSLNSRIALSATEFLFGFLGRPISSIMPSGS